MKVDKAITGYYDVTLSDREVKAGSHIYNKILDILAEKAVEVRPDTYIQKTAVEVTRVLGLDFITRGVLHFGKVLALPPANAIKGIGFNETELPNFTDEDEFNLLVKEKCNEFDYQESKESISAVQHEMYDDYLYMSFDRFIHGLEKGLSVEEMFTILDQMNERFEELSDESLTRKRTEKHLNVFSEIAKDLLWKKNRYAVDDDIKYTFGALQRMVGNCRFYDTVRGDSEGAYKEVTKKGHPVFEEEFKRNLEDLILKLKTYTKIDQRKSELVVT